jgi:PAS domain-containing protein
VSHGQIERLRSVAEREIRAFRLERALNETLLSASQYKKQLKAFLAGSVDAIAHVQEGILVDANRAWADLFGHPQADDLVGAPLMDFFDRGDQAALKARSSPVAVVSESGRQDRGRTAGAPSSSSSKRRQSLRRPAVSSASACRAGRSGSSSSRPFTRTRRRASTTGGGFSRS